MENSVVVSIVLNTLRPMNTLYRLTMVLTLCMYFVLQWLCIAYRFVSLSKNLFVNSNHSNGCLDICPWGIGLKWLTHFTNSNKSSLILVLFTSHEHRPNESSLYDSHRLQCPLFLSQKLKFRTSLSSVLGIFLQC